MNTPTCKPDCGSPDTSSLTLDEALAHIRESLVPVTGMHRVAVRDALGRVLGEDIRAPADVPSSAKSAMDGYAVRHADAEVAHHAGLRRVSLARALAVNPPLAAARRTVHRHGCARPQSVAP